MNNPFFEEEEEKLVQEFLSKGFASFPHDSVSVLNNLKQKFFDEAVKRNYVNPNVEISDFFDYTHKYVPRDQLNDYRLKLIQIAKDDQNLRPNLYKMARNQLNWVLGSELAMQRSANISIQFPEDASSLLPLHSDVWSGNSPYEVVLWTPLVDVYRTRSMFIFPMGESEKMYRDFAAFSKMNSEEFFKCIESKVTWIEIPYGHALIFSHTLPHGNRINREPLSRWSLNIRFKSLLSPYGSKEVGETFLPITLRPATRIGHAYRNPECEK